MTSASESNKKAAKLINFAYLCFLVAWSLGIVFLLCKLFFLGNLLVMAKEGNVYINDFLHFYCAGQLVAAGQGLHVYDPHVQMQFMDRLIAPLHVSQVFYIQYVPFVFPLCVPISLLPLPISYIAWTLDSLVFISISANLLHRYYNRFAKFSSTAVIFLGLFATLANLESLELGQLGSLLLLLATIYIVSGPCNNKENSSVLRDLIAGCSLSLCSIKPHYAVFLAIPCVALRRWRVLVFAAVSELLLLLLAGLTIGWENILSYPSMLIAAESNPSYGGVHPEHMVSVRGMLSRLLPDVISLKISLAIMSSSIFALSVVWFTNARASQTDREHLTALTIATMLVVSPHTNLYDCVMLVIPAYLMLPSLDIPTIFSSGQSFAKACGIILLLYPLLSALTFVAWEFILGARENPTFFFLLHLALVLCLAGAMVQRRMNSAKM